MDRAAEFRREYIGGDMLLMAGNSREHVMIVTNLVREFSSALKGRPCDTYSTEMRTKSSDTAYAYPDVIIACGEPQFLDETFDTLTNPTVIFEVLSPSTRDYDRGEKFTNYKHLETLRHYVLVAQDRPFVELFTINSSGEWERLEVVGLDSTVYLPAVDCSVAMSDIYYRVRLPRN